MKNQVMMRPQERLESHNCHQQGRLEIRMMSQLMRRQHLTNRKLIMRGSVEIRKKNQLQRMRRKLQKNRTLIMQEPEERHKNHQH